MSIAGIGSRFASVLAVLVLTAGCPGLQQQASRFEALELGPLPATPPPNALRCGAARDTTDQRFIDASGGLLRLPNGHSLTVPANAVDQRVHFHMTERAADYVLVKFGPENRPFSLPVEVTLSSAACGDQQPADLAVYRWHDAQRGWERVEVDSLARVATGPGLTATFRVEGFTNFALATP
jgi:hypothetical protein